MPSRRNARRRRAGARWRRGWPRRVPGCGRPTRCPMCSTPRWSRAPRWRSGRTAVSPSGPVPAIRRASASNSPRRSAWRKIGCASWCRTSAEASEAAHLAKQAGRPVAVQWTRAEEFTWAYFRPAALIEIEAGLDAGKAISAWDFTNYNSGGSGLDTPYRIPNTRARFVASDAPLRQSSYRVLAATANNFAREAFTDELAEAAGKDPLEFRLSHLDNERMRNVLNAAAQRFAWVERRKKRRPGTGIGLACGTEKNSVVAACCEVEVDRASGVPRLIEVVQAFECGAILNPTNLRSQVEGAIMMGVGPALREEILFKEGKLTNARFATYRVPRLRDLPKLEAILLDRKDLESAGAGETPIIVIAPAIANAVFHATGKPVHAMPIRASG